MSSMIWFDIQFFAICSLPLCNCTTRLKASLQLCAESLRRLYSDYFVPQASNLFCLPCCYISPQWCQAGLRSAITLKNNGVKGQSEPLSQRDHAISLRRQAPALSSALTYWLRYLLAVPLLTCNLLLAAAESEPDDKSLLGRSMFHGLDVLTVKLCLSVPSALRLNVKQPGMEGSLWGDECVFWCLLADWTMNSREPSREKQAAACARTSASQGSKYNYRTDMVVIIAYYWHIWKDHLFYKSMVHPLKTCLGVAVCH